MLELTDEIKIINSAITFATEKGFDYLILRCLTNTNFKKVEINLGKGIQFEKPLMLFGADFGVKDDGKLRYPQVHVFSLGNNYMKETEELRKYLEKDFPEFECKW